MEDGREGTAREAGGGQGEAHAHWPLCNQDKPQGREVSVHIDKDAACFGMLVPIKLELWVPPETGIGLMMGFRCDQKGRHTPSADKKGTGGQGKAFSRCWLYLLHLGCPL